MIEGLKVTIPAADLRALCVKAADHHRDRAATYAGQIDNLRSAQVEGMNYTNGNPIESLTARHEQHVAEEAELRFVARYLKDGEDYLLDRADLATLGIVRTDGMHRLRW